MNQLEDFTCKQILVLLAWKGKSQIYLLQLFAILFSFTIFKQFFNILGTKKNWNRPFLTKDIIFFNFHSLAHS